MTLMKSLLLGSAAALVTVAAAQAADLPTKKGAPAAEYVRICKINGIAGFVIPGTDTCLKINGEVNFQISGGSVKNGYAYPGAAVSSGKYRDDIGWYGRGEVDFTAVSNTAYGPLLSYIGVRENMGSGFDTPGGYGLGGNTSSGDQTQSYWAYAYIQWAGLTAGYHRSFYDFIGGGETWKDIFSPDHNGDQGVGMLAYTATFGGGFAATIAIQEPQNTNNFVNTFNSGATGLASDPTYTNLGHRAPDIVAALDLTQSWGAVHLAGAAHDNRVEDLTYAAAPVAGVDDKDVWGFAGIAGVQFNLPQLGAGDNIMLQTAYSDGATSYSGVSSPGWGEGDHGFNPGGAGTIFPTADGLYNDDGAFKTAQAWTVAAVGVFQLTPNFAVKPEAAYGTIKYNAAAAAEDGVSKSASGWVVGTVLDWSPVKNLDFALDLVYLESRQDKVLGTTTPTSADGVSFRLHVIRDF